MKPIAASMGVGRLNLGTGYQPQKAGQHHRHQSTDRARFRPGQGFFEPDTGDGVMRMVTTDRGDEDIDVSVIAEGFRGVAPLPDQHPPPTRLAP